MLEAAIEGQAVKEAEAEGFFVRKVAWPGRRNAPDRVFSRKDRGTVWIEFKRPGEEARLGQVREHERMRAAGMEVHVCDDLREARRVLGLRRHNGGPALDTVRRLV